MRNTRIVAILTGASLVVGAGAAVATSENGTSRTAAGSLPVAAAALRAPLPADATATMQIDQLGALGAVTKAVSELLAAAQPPTGPVDAAKVKARLAALQAAAKELLAMFPTTPPAALPVQDARYPAPPAPPSLPDAVATLLADADALVKAIIGAAPSTPPMSPPASRPMSPPASPPMSPPASPSVAAPTTYPSKPPTGKPAGPTTDIPALVTALAKSDLGVVNATVAAIGAGAPAPVN